MALAALAVQRAGRRLSMKACTCAMMPSSIPLCAVGARRLPVRSLAGIRTFSSSSGSEGFNHSRVATAFSSHSFTRLLLGRRRLNGTLGFGLLAALAALANEGACGDIGSDQLIGM